MARRAFIPMAVPVLGAEELANVTEAVETGWISGVGSYVRAFEEGFAQACGVAHGVAVSNGTTALHLAMAILGVGPGDEVIVPAITHIAAVNAVLYQGATPVVVDCDPLTWCIDPAAVEAALTERTRAVVAVHLYGNVADVDALNALAKPRGIKVVEDAAEAHGATRGGRYAGALGDLATFSFYANKIITTGEGGMLTTDDAELADSARRLRDLAYDPDYRFMHRELGFNFRLTNMQAAVGVAQLARLEGFVEHRRSVAARYTERLADLSGVTVPTEPEGVKHVHWMYALLVDGDRRGDLMRRLKADHGIDSRTFFYPAHRQPLLVDRLGEAVTGLELPVSERLGAEGMNLPSGNELTLEEVDAVCDAVREILD